jgi:hypothetical protein
MLTRPPQLPPPSLAAYNPFHKQEQTYGPPRPAPGGVVGWFNDRLRAFKNRNNRTATGAYEGHSTSGARGGARGFGPLDPDEAWDSRVGNEADTYGPGGYYEEQELRDTNTAYGGAGGGLTGNTYNMNLAATPGMPPAGFGGGDVERGRTLNRSPGLGAPSGRNPFDDDAEPSNISLRGVSPRPIDTSSANKGKGKEQQGDENSPTERKSIFRENM